MILPPKLKPVAFVASAREDISAMPEQVKRAFGQALYEAQCGGMSRFAKPLKGFGGSSVVEIVENHDGDTFRAIYTVRFAGVLYVLHAFQKKAAKGAKTPRIEMDRIRTRLKIAEDHHTSRQADEKSEGAAGL